MSIARMYNFNNGRYNLTHKTTNTNKYNMTGVYKLKCSTCPNFYIGQTGRSFPIRYKEHINALTKPHMNSSFADHLLITGHTYNNIEHNMEVLHTLTKNHKLNTTNNFEIYKHHKQNKTPILNDKIHFHTHTHTHTHSFFTILPIKDHRTPPPTILFPTPTLYHHKQPHKVKTPRTPVQRPHVVTDEVQNQHETTVSQKLRVYYIAALLKSSYYIIK